MDKACSMKRRQKILLETWCVMGLFVSVFLIRDLAKYVPFALVVVAIYYFYRNSILTEIQRIGPTPKSIVVTSKFWKNFIVAYYFVLLLVSLILLVYHIDFRKYLASFSALFIILTFPILGPVAISQYKIFVKLGNENDK